MKLPTILASLLAVVCLSTFPMEQQGNTVVLTDEEVAACTQQDCVLVSLERVQAVINKRVEYLVNQKMQKCGNYI